MKHSFLKVVVSLMVFVGTLFITGNIMNRGNVNTTRDMSEASLPGVYMVIGGETVNELFGYVDKMDQGILRENITPLEENRGVSFRIIKYNQIVENINLKVRTIDGSRLVESLDVTEYSEDNYAINASVTLNDLMTDHTEYSLEINLTLSGGRSVTYYTRIVEGDDYCTKEKLAFAINFAQKEISEKTNGELKGYMESNYLGDNTTLAKVNIHSSMKQLAFGDLNVVRETEPVINIKEIAAETAVFVTNYVVRAVENEVATHYYVEEYMRIKYTPTEIYLLDFNRTMDEITPDRNSMFGTQNIMLGITSKDSGLIESDDGNLIAFVAGGDLYSYNLSEAKAAVLFSFADEYNYDARTFHDDYAIKPLRIDEAGNVWFSVCGYMNRGNEEGRVGVGLYYYNGVTNVVDKLFFIKSSKSAEAVMKEMDELSYLSAEGIFFFMHNKAICSIDVESKESEVIVDNLEENRYSVSDDSTMIVWQDGTDVNKCELLKIMNLTNRQIMTIKALKNTYIKPLAFLGEDFIYGIAHKEDVVTDETGRTTFPMYIVKIQNKTGETLKTYMEEGVFVTGLSAEGNLLTLSRVKKSEKQEGTYVAYSNDYISNNQEKESHENETVTFTNGNYESCVRIHLKRAVDKKTVLLTPKEVIYEGDKFLTLNGDETDRHFYYVYYGGKLQKVYTNESMAVNAANTNYGTVLNEKGYYVWYRANRSVRNQIMNLSFDKVSSAEETDSLCYCLDKMTEYAGSPLNSEYEFSIGESVLSMLRKSLANENVLDLTGAALDSILYYVNRDIPVLAITNDDKAYLIIGYNQLAIVLMDPYNGTYKIGMNEAEKMFSENGNQFFTYVTNY